MNSIDGISIKMLHRYVETRHKIDAEANIISSLTSMLTLLGTSGDDKIEVVPIALGKINQLLNTHILNIWEILDDFIYIIQAQSILDNVDE